MKRHYKRNNEQGAVAILAGLTIFVLFGFLALVADLGNLYVNKTELQNAADAAALSGAMELVGTSLGVDTAVQRAIEAASLNKSALGSQPVVITAANIRFSDSSTGPVWADVAEARAKPGNKYFIKVDTSGIEQGTLQTWFIRVLSPSTTTTTTYGLAVAGRAQCNALPMFTCAKPGGTAPNYGFIPGQSYQFTPPSPGASSTIGPGNVGYMNPAPPGAPDLYNDSVKGADRMGEAICQGRNYCMSGGNTYTSLTQPAFNKMADALNTRFGEYSAAYKGMEAVCRPDKNVKEYPFEPVKKPPEDGTAKDWMSGSLKAQSEDDLKGLGVHWAAVRPTDPSAASPAVNTGANGYPATGTPYSQQTGKYFAPPKDASGNVISYGKDERRIVMFGISTGCPVGSGSGNSVKIDAFARFFLQVKADGTGAKTIYGEFIDTLTATPTEGTSVKLYQ